MNFASADQVRAERLVLNQNLATQHIGYIVKAKLRAMDSEGINAAIWARVVQNLRRNNATIQYLRNEPGVLINETEKMC